MPRINLNNVEMGRVIAASAKPWKQRGSNGWMDGWRDGYSTAADTRQSVNDDNEYFKKYNI